MIEFVLLLLELIEIGQSTVDLVEEIIGLLGGVEEVNYDDLTLEQKTVLLKQCTKTVANLKLNLSCYPLGFATTLLFDLDGNPIP